MSTEEASAAAPPTGEAADEVAASPAEPVPAAPQEPAEPEMKPDPPEDAPPIASEPPPEPAAKVETDPAQAAVTPAKAEEPSAEPAAPQELKKDSPKASPVPTPVEAPKDDAAKEEPKESPKAPQEEAATKEPPKPAAETASEPPKAEEPKKDSPKAAPAAPAPVAAAAAAAAPAEQPPAKAQEEAGHSQTQDAAAADEPAAAPASDARAPPPAAPTPEPAARATTAPAHAPKSGRTSPAKSDHFGQRTGGGMSGAASTTRSRADLIDDPDDYPGPGHYHIPTTIGDAPKRSIIPRRPLPGTKNDGPGPGHYPLPPVIGQVGNGWPTKLGHPNPWLATPTKEAFGKYDVATSLDRVLRSPPRHRFGTGPARSSPESLRKLPFAGQEFAKSGAYHGLEGPGPGAYSAPNWGTRPNTSHSYSLLGRTPAPGSTSIEKSRKLPGPGSYTLSPVIGETQARGVVHKNFGGPKFGSEIQRPLLRPTVTPNKFYSPVDSAVSLRARKPPAFGFGSAPRFKTRKSRRASSPGPTSSTATL
eukprot:tig00000042_g15628.t1